MYNLVALVYIHKVVHWSPVSNSRTFLSSQKEAPTPSGVVTSHSFYNLFFIKFLLASCSYQAAASGTLVIFLVSSEKRITF